jgi:hypothetical protein
MKQRFEQRRHIRNMHWVDKKYNRLRDNLVRKCLVRPDDDLYVRIGRAFKQAHPYPKLVAPMGAT